MNGKDLQEKCFSGLIQSTFLRNDRLEKIHTPYVFFNGIKADRDMFSATEANKDE